MIWKKMIIGLVGEKFAGKDVISRHLVEKYAAFHIKFSILLDEILNILNLPISRRNEIDLGLAIRDVFGADALYQGLKKRVLESNAEMIIINGIRMDEGVRIIKDLGARIVYITAPTELRFKRYQLRREKADDGKMNFEQFVEQEKEATEIGIPELGAKADYRIDNTATLQELYSKVDEIIKTIK